MKQVIMVFAIAIIVLSCNRTGNKAPVSEQKIIADIQVVNNGNVGFDNYFFNKTMRLDYFHSGTATEEHFAKDMVVSDGPWGGSRKILIDKLKLGLCFYEVIERESKVLLYSHGFASVFGEWQSIPEA